MSVFDIIVLFMIGAGAVTGFLRGFVHEALSLLSWILIIAAIRLLHAPLSAWLSEPIGSEAGAAVLAFLAILSVTYALGKWIARSMGRKSRKSVLGPIDRVLGFGFGAIKGLIMVTMLFLLVVMGYATLFGGDTKLPQSMKQSRTYPLLSASGEAISAFVRERRRNIKAKETEAKEVS